MLCNDQAIFIGGVTIFSQYYMVSCYVYDRDSPPGGEDSFFIQQYEILNGASGRKYWAGTGVDINEES